MDKVTLIEIDHLNVSSKEQEIFLHTWQSWLKSADNRITLISRIYNSSNDGLSMLVRGIFYGKPDFSQKEISELVGLTKNRPDGSVLLSSDDSTLLDNTNEISNPLSSDAYRGFRYVPNKN